MATDYSTTGDIPEGFARFCITEGCPPFRLYKQIDVGFGFTMWDYDGRVDRDFLLPYYYTCLTYKVIDSNNKESGQFTTPCCCENLKADSMYVTGGSVALGESATLFLKPADVGIGELNNCTGMSFEIQGGSGTVTRDSESNNLLYTAPPLMTGGPFDCSDCPTICLNCGGVSTCVTLGLYGIAYTDWLQPAYFEEQDGECNWNEYQDGDCKVTQSYYNCAGIHLYDITDLGCVSEFCRDCYYGYTAYPPYYKLSDKCGQSCGCATDATFDLRNAWEPTGLCCPVALL